MSGVEATDAAVPAAPRKEFADVYERYFLKLRAFFVAAGFTRSDAEDLSQTTLLNVYKAWESYRGEGELDAWVYTAARNLAKDAWRGSARRPGPLDDAEDVREPSPPADVRAEGSQRLARVRAGLAKLPVKMRTCFLLYVQEGLTAAEVARRLGIAETTVRIQVWQARRRLKGALDDGGGS